MRTVNVNWDGVIDTIQAGLVWFIIIVVTLCTATLILFDVLAGTGVDYYLTQGNLFVSVIISMATTGLLMALMFIGYTFVEKKNSSIIMKKVGKLILIVAGFVFVLDVIFDSLSADVMSYGRIVSMSEMENPSVHWMFRALLAGISVIGETLALAIIMGMPVLKDMINNALPPQYQTTQRQSTYRQQPFRHDTNSPVFSGIPRAQPKRAVQSSFIQPEPRYEDLT